MSASDPPIIQGDHPFKVEAVLSKTGGINALAKRPKKMVKGEVIRSDHQETLPSEAMHTDERVHLAPSMEDGAENSGPLREDAFDTLHREQFVDPSRRLKTNQRVKIQSSPDADDASMQIPPEDKSHLASVAPLGAGHALESLAQPEEASASTSAAVAASEPETAPASNVPAAVSAEAEAQEQRQQFLRRIEQIKHTNESVGKDLEALEKLTQSRTPLKPAD